MPPHRRFKSYPLAGVFRLAGEIHVVLDRFKSYPLVGVFQPTTGAKNGRTMFQVIPPCGGIRIQYVRTFHISSFKSYPLAGVFVNVARVKASDIASFKSYPLAGVFANHRSLTSSQLLFQVIPPCGGIPAHARRELRQAIVSSHTPLRGYSQENPTFIPRCWSFKSYPLAGVFGKIGFASTGVSISVSSHTPLRGYSLSVNLWRI